jgi:DNA-binding NarL/FixJ family response regulator
LWSRVETPPDLPKGISVIIVEDHRPVREALAAAVINDPCTHLVTTCNDLHSASSVLDQVCPDVLLIDLGLPNGSGLQLFLQAPSGCACAVLTQIDHEEHLLAAIRCGARGFVFKSDTEAQWMDTIRLLADGQGTMHAALAQLLLELPAAPDDARTSLLRWFAAGYTREEVAERLNCSPDAVGRRVRAIYDRMVEPRPNLTPREIQLLRLLDKGFPFKQCAKMMGVSESTTKTQAARAYERLEATNLQSALYKARRFGFVS